MGTRLSNGCERRTQRASHQFPDRTVLSVGGWPSPKGLDLLTWRTVRGYHFNSF